MTDEPANLARGETLVPPRPNLGPEPWDDDGATWFGATGWGVALGLLVLALVWRWQRTRGRQPVPADRAEEAVPPVDPRIVASGLIRDALARRFGPAWGSKTTEEIEAEASLRDRLAPDQFAALIDLFRQSDRAKFAEPATTGPEAAAQIAIDALLMAIEAAGPPAPPGPKRRRATRASRPKG